jgi:hypothetical protein
MEILALVVILSQWILILLLIFRKKEEPKPPSLTLTEPQSLNILRRAYKKAQEIIGQAELSSVKLHAESEMATQKVSDQLTEETKKKLDEYLGAMTTEGKSQVARFLEDFKKDTTAAAQKSLEDYKNARMKMIDDNISVVVQRAIELVVSKKLSADTQIDLIYEALEQAKQEKLIN